MPTDLRSVIRDVPDFPQKRIIFRDITPVLQNPEYLKTAVSQVAGLVAGLDFSLVAGPESRGFIFGVPAAVVLGKGFIPVRKAGKLPYDTISRKYDLEYGSAEIEIHADAINAGDRVVIIDDLLATGGTCKALCELIESAGGTVAGIAFLIELGALNGRELLKGYDVRSVLVY